MPVADFPGASAGATTASACSRPWRSTAGRTISGASSTPRTRCGIGVILDVVYNHLGPDGNYLTQYSADYFTDRYENEWGEAINFDGRALRAGARIRGLRTPPTGPRSFTWTGCGWMRPSRSSMRRRSISWPCSRDRLREAARGRQSIVVAENEPQHTVLVRPRDRGGYGLDALWNDDFHHAARVALTGSSEAYYSDYQGTAAGADFGGQVRVPLPGPALLLAVEAARHAGLRACAPAQFVTSSRES